MFIRQTTSCDQRIFVLCCLVFEICSPEISRKVYRFLSTVIKFARFSRDVDTIDNGLRQTLQGWLRTLFQVASALVVITYSTPVVFFALIPILVVYYILLVSRKNVYKQKVVISVLVLALFRGLVLRWKANDHDGFSNI